MCVSYIWMEEKYSWINGDRNERMCLLPEGVEVKLSAEIIKPLVVGKQIITAFVGKNSRYKNKPPEGFEDFVSRIGSSVCRVIDVKTKGKFMYWELDHFQCLWQKK